MVRADFRFSHFDKPFPEIAGEARGPSDVQSVDEYWYNAGRRCRLHRKAALVLPSPGLPIGLRSPRYYRRVQAAICLDARQLPEPPLFPFALTQSRIRVQFVDRWPATRQFRARRLPTRKLPDLHLLLHKPRRRSWCTRWQQKASSPTVSKLLSFRRL